MRFLKTLLTALDVADAVDILRLGQDESYRLSIVATLRGSEPSARGSGKRRRSARDWTGRSNRRPATAG